MSFRYVHPISMYGISSRQASSEAHLRDISAALKEANVDHHLWVEQPESIVTAISTKPVPRSSVHPALRALKLLRAFPK